MFSRGPITKCFLVYFLPWAPLIRGALPARAGEAVGGRRACTLEVVVSHPGKVLLPLR